MKQGFFKGIILTIQAWMKNNILQNRLVITGKECYIYIKEK